MMMLHRKKAIWLLAPGLTGFVIFYLAPFGFSFYYSLIENTFTKKFVGFDNFKIVLSNQYYRIALKNTFQFTGIGVPVLVIFSLVLAILLVSDKGGKHPFFKASFVIPVLLPSAAVVVIWHVFFGNDSLFMAHFASGLDSVKGSIWQKAPVLMFFFWKNAGFNMILFIAGIVSIPQDIYEACAIEGASSFQKHYYLTLPLLMPTSFFVVIISTINSFRIFKETFLLYGAYPSEMLYLVQHYMNNHFNKLNYQFITTGAIIFAFIVYVIVAAGYKIENRMNRGIW